MRRRSARIDGARHLVASRRIDFYTLGKRVCHVDVPFGVNGRIVRESRPQSDLPDKMRRSSLILRNGAAGVVAVPTRDVDVMVRVEGKSLGEALDIEVIFRSLEFVAVENEDRTALNDVHAGAVYAHNGVERAMPDFVESVVVLVRPQELRRASQIECGDARVIWYDPYIECFRLYFFCLGGMTYSAP